MLTKFWEQFKSGTDIRGIASQGINGEDVNLTNEVIGKIVKSFALWLSEHCSKNTSQLTVSVGHDSRISAQRIKNEAINSLTSMGINVLDCSLSSTPAMFMTTIDLNCDGAIQITASHHPFNRNGLKFFTKDGGLNSKDIESILLVAQQNKSYTTSAWGTVSKIDYMDKYAYSLRKLICDEVDSDDFNHPLNGFKIVVDAGNGAGGFYAKKVLLPLGADISGSQFLEPDGMFPNHIPNPENSEAIESVRKATVKNGADLGIIFDTDVDRCGAIDCCGTEINRNRLIALASAIVLNEHPGATIVTDSVTSKGLHEYIHKDLGGIHHRFKRGYKNVINEAIRLNELGIDCPLAIETSGHAALRENYFLDDGAYLITKIIIKMAQLKKCNKSLSSLISNLKEPLETIELRISINTQDFKSYGEKIIEDLKSHAKSIASWETVENNYEGVRINFNSSEQNGWALLRLSVHDPMMPLNIESDVTGGSLRILEQIYLFLSKYEKLDCSKIYNKLFV